MVTPPKGDTASVPLNPAGRKVADAWDLAADRARGDLCKAFGPPALVRQPGRIRIRWEDDNTLLLEFDAGTQTRRFHFDPRTPAARSVQGHSQARWFRQPQSRGIFGRGAAAAGGSLEAVTTNLRAGYLRPNGVPYGERAVVKEFFDTLHAARGRLVADRDHRRQRSRVPDAGIRAQLAVQEGNRHVEVEPAAMRHPAAAGGAARRSEIGRRCAVADF